MTSVLKLHKTIALLISVMLVVTISIPVFAQEVKHSENDDNTATITIYNTTAGDTYQLYQLFDADIDDNDAVVYTGDIPEALSEYFTYDASGNIGSLLPDMTEELQYKLTFWADETEPMISVKSDGSSLYFDNLPYGYYVVRTHQGDQTVVVHSASPDVILTDKSGHAPGKLTYTVDDDNVAINDVVTYTIQFETANFDEAGDEIIPITSYEIENEFADCLQSENVLLILLDTDGDITTTLDQTELEPIQFTDGHLILDWSSDDAQLYPNGTHVFIIYEAVVDSNVNIDGNGNLSTVTVTWHDEDDEQAHSLGSATAVIYSYAFAIKAVSGNGNNRDNAEFLLPFYVQADVDEDGAYLYDGTTDNNELSVNSISTSGSGEIIIKGVEADTDITVNEMKRQDQSHPQTIPYTVTPVQTGMTSTHKSWSFNRQHALVEDAEYNPSSPVRFDNDHIAVGSVILAITTAESVSIGALIFAVVGAGGILAVVIALIVTRKKHVQGSR